jgi:hypothetical protein
MIINDPALRADVMSVEQRTARLTLLIDPRKKAAFEKLCAEEDSTPSQVVRRLIRGYIEEQTGRPWRPEAMPERGSAGSSRVPDRARRKRGRR